MTALPTGAVAAKGWPSANSRHPIARRSPRSHGCTRRFLMERRTFRHRPGNLDRFIEGAGTPTEASEEMAVTSTAAYPWESARTDVQKLFNLRLPEQHLLMLRFIAEHTP